MIDYDEIFDWKIWQIFKWITGTIILGGIIIGIYYFS